LVLLRILLYLLFQFRRLIADAKFAEDGVPKNVAIPAPSELIPVPPLATGSIPVTPVVSGNPVAFVKVPPDGVPSAPPLVTNAPAVPTLTPNAVATPVPKPDIFPTATKDAVVAVPVKFPTNVVDVTEVKPASVVDVAPNAVEVLPIVILELTKFELATVAAAISVPVIVASTIISDVTLPDPIEDTPVA
jgi:hypothetical protein